MTSQMAFVPVTRLDEFVLCVCVNTLHSECIVCDFSITVCVVGGGKRWRFACVAVCWLNPLEETLPRQTGLFSFFFFFVNKSGKCNYNKFSNQSLEETTNQYGDGNL